MPSEDFFGSSAIVRGIARCSREQQQKQSLTCMLRHILPKLLDGQLRSVNVASVGQASRERIELRRLWRWNRLRLALFIYLLSELTISVQIVKLYPYCCAFSLVNHSMEAGAALVMYTWHEFSYGGPRPSIFVRQPCVSETKSMVPLKPAARPRIETLPDCRKVGASAPL